MSDYPIEHVFVLMLENRAFDHLFALSGIDGIAAAKPNDPAYSNTALGRTFEFHDNAPSSLPTDPLHEFEDVVQQLTGNGHFDPTKPYPPINNGGFAANYATTFPRPDAAQPGLVMAGAVPDQLPATVALAKEFVLCDGWYASMPGPTWPNRFFVHGASAMGFTESPSKWQLAKWETFNGFRYENGSVYDALGKSNCRLYQDKSGPIFGQIPQVGSLHNISFFDVHGLDRFAHDIENDNIGRYTFIEPAYGDIISATYRSGSSQHPMDSIAGGDTLVARIYNTLRASSLWDRSVLVITYDEHGGFYDSQHPVPMTPPGDVTGGGPYGGNGFDFSLSGVRVPAIVVSPWVARGKVDSTIYDHSSVAATLHKLFDMPQLTHRDRNASDLTHLLQGDYRDDCPEDVVGATPPAADTSEPAAMAPEKAAEPVPDGSNLMGFLYVVEKARREMGEQPELLDLSGEGDDAFPVTRGDAAAYLIEHMPRLEEFRRGQLLA